MTVYTEQDDYRPQPTYSRPGPSAWIAAASVALAVFVLGGFIKTYQRLEALREESRKEIQDLRAKLDEARRPAPAGTPAPAAAPVRLPPAAAPASEQLPAAPEYDLGSNELDQNEEPRFQLGRSSRREGGFGRVLDDPFANRTLQVVAVSADNGQRRVMVEGGRDMGWSAGTRLELSRRGKWLGDLRVLDVYDTMSACEVLHATQQPEPGDVIRRP